MNAPARTSAKAALKSSVRSAPKRAAQPPAQVLRWRRRKEARAPELLAAALALFVEKGYAATRLEEIADRAGVSKGTLYLYFESKEELFKAVVREGMAPLLAEGEEWVASTPGPAGDLLRAVVLRWWEAVGDGPLGGILKLVFAEARNFPEIARFYTEEVIGRGWRLLSTILRRGVDSGEFRPFNPDALAHIVFSPLVLRTIWMHSIGCCGVAHIPADGYLREYLELTLRGLRSEERA
ncbi:MAG: TetR/AcrR family transcriptional regulator [Zoogloeaceae bacterium]|nr:TetR/AcrR family transcriptional regulator [Zoogloeaceae bacterium]